MKKIWATLKKEWLVLRYDVAGLTLLLLMPALLIIIMAVVQDAPFKEYQEMVIDLLVVDEDGGALSKEIKEGLRHSKNYRLVDEIDGQALTAQKMQELLRNGDYKVGIIIPNKGTAEMVNTANQLANHISGLMGNGNRLPSRESREEIKVIIHYDPTVKPQYKMSIGFGIDRFLSAASSKLLLDRIQKMNALAGTPNNDSSLMMDEALLSKMQHGIGLEEHQHKVEHNDTHVTYNSVQHNVPAWALFGMFFIIIPIVGNVIREREDGSALRISLIPNSSLFVTLGRIFFYMLICLLQFVCMMFIGKLVLPLFDLPALHMGHHYLALLLVVLCSAYAATALGHLIGKFFKTNNQALPFSAINIVIISAVSGIWVPMELLPHWMQQFAKVSPIYWSLRGINDLFLRSGDVRHVLLESGVLFLFGTAFWVLSTYLMRRQSNH